ncbi:MAG: extracellular solute-binding protein [Patescibacteria group bacterium]|jgi:multiple sugar transport system substrate-binding protein
MLNPARQQNGLSKIFILLILGGIAAIILTVVLVIFQSQKSPPPAKITLNIWGVWDDTSDLKPIIDAYRRAHPYVNIKYSKIRYEEYEDMLLNGWANQPSTGPDIYALPNTWLKKYNTRGFITPIPKTTSVTNYTTSQIIFKQEVQYQEVTENSLTTSDIKRNYVDLVYGDIIQGGKILGLPLGINPLELFYNRNLLDQAHLVQPPQTWAEFASAVSNMTTIDEQNKIVRAAAALGTSNNISYPQDILTLLMLQNGTVMATGSKIAFDKPSATDAAYFPGEEALRFYTDFTSPEKAVYTWGTEMPNALDYFAEGNLAFFFGYPFQEAEIKSKSRGIDYGVAPVPQINPESEINVANYWVYTVSHKASNKSLAWNFLQFATKAKYVKSYVNSTKQSSALRSVLQQQILDPDRGPVLQQVLTAQNWYHGSDQQDADQVLQDMITSVVTNGTPIKDALMQAAKKIDKSY